MASEIEKVCVISSDLQFRKGITQLLNNTKSVKAFHCECENVTNTLTEAISNSNPSVVLIQTHLPAIQELDIIKGLKDKFPNLGVLVYSAEIDELTIVELINSGAKGIISDKTDLKQLENAILEIAENGFFFSPEIIANLTTFQTLSSQTSINLSKDEMFILKEIASGNIMIETCANGEYSSEQYEQLRATVLEKTGCTSNSGLAMFSLMTDYRAPEPKQ